MKELIETVTRLLQNKTLTKEVADEILLAIFQVQVTTNLQELIIRLEADATQAKMDFDQTTNKSEKHKTSHISYLYETKRVINLIQEKIYKLQ
jgi:hypothetical protein